MRRTWLIPLAFFAGAACNLTSTPPTRPPDPSPIVEATSIFVATVTPSTVAGTPTLVGAPTLVGGPTLVPPPNLLVTTAPLPSAPVTSAPVLGALCPVYTTYSGARSDNKLSLRSAPSAGAAQVFRVPNQVEVLIVPGSIEVEAEGYHWLNVIYVESPQVRYQGWIARDSYQLDGVRDPSVATLRPTGNQAPC